jgi:hypothetical protein
MHLVCARASSVSMPEAESVDPSRHSLNPGDGLPLSRMHTLDGQIPRRQLDSGATSAPCWVTCIVNRAPRRTVALGLRCCCTGGARTLVTGSEAAKDRLHQAQNLLGLYSDNPVGVLQQCSRVQRVQESVATLKSVAVRSYFIPLPVKCEL